MPASGTAEPRLAPEQAAPPEEEPGQLVGIGAAALRAGVSERALRYYQELGLLTPSGCTPGGMRRYSEADLARVARIRELADKGHTLAAALRITALEDDLAAERALTARLHARLAPNLG